MARPGTVIGWKLDRAERDELLLRFPPRFATVIADHVTLETRAADKPLPPPVGAAIVGHTHDDSLEAMVVAIDGGVDRPDGSTYHISWSLGPGRHARESNDVLRERGWVAFEKLIPVTLTPARF